MNDQDGYRIEAAMQFGFSQTEDDGPYTCTEAQLIAFAKACERKGLAMAHGLGNRDAVYRHILDLDAELAPVLAAEEERSMTAAGYVRGTDEPGKRWVKPSEEPTQVSDRLPDDILETLKGCVIEPCGSRVTCNPPPMDTDRDLLVEMPDDHEKISSIVSSLDACENCMNTGLKNPTAEDLK